MEDFLEEEQKPGRPAFLKWLCILTFIGSGLGIFSNSYSSITGQTFNVKVSEKRNIKEDTLHARHIADTMQNKFAKRMITQGLEMAKPENVRKLSEGKLLGDVLCLTGAILMWLLRRRGFYFYIVGCIVSAAVPLIIFGTNFLSIAQTSISVFFGALFIIFYAMNLKSMR